MKGMAIGAGPAGMVLTLLTLGSCAGVSEEACRTTDWHQAGYDDALAGRSADYLAASAESCAPDGSAYANGHAAGVAAYCQPAKGFALGAAGAEAARICPTALATDFLRSYTLGRQLYEAQNDLAQLSAARAGLESELKDLRHPSPYRIARRTVAPSHEVAREAALEREVADLKVRETDLRRQVSALKSNAARLVWPPQENSTLQRQSGR